MSEENITNNRTDAANPRLLASTVTITMSEMQLDPRFGSFHGIAMDLGRMAGEGHLIGGLHPGNIAFDGEKFILHQWGSVNKIEPKAAALLPWLAEMRTNWGEAFPGFIAGFVQGIRATTATSHPELGRQLLDAIGGTISPKEPVWPLRAEFAASLGRTQLRGGESPMADLSALQQTACDVDEQAALSMLARTLSIEPSSMITGPVAINYNFESLKAAVPESMSSPEHQRQLWLLAFFLAHLGNMACDLGDVTRGTTLLQAGQLVLQRGVASPEYFESALACCIHRETRRIRITPARSGRNDVFSCLAYSNSRAVTSCYFFQASRNHVESGRAKNLMWTAIWGALDRLRACEAAFVAWAGNDPPAYTGAAPVLLNIARTHGAILANLGNALQMAYSKSIRVPWLSVLNQLLPKLQRELEWCHSIAQLAPNSPSLRNHFAAAATFIDGKNPGINSISFLPTM